MNSIWLLNRSQGAGIVQRPAQLIRRVSPKYVRSGPSIRVSAPFSTLSDEVKMLEKLLNEAKARKVAEDSVATDAASSAGNSNAPKFHVGTFNAISQKGLAKFSPSDYRIIPMSSDAAKSEEIHVILLRSYKLGGSDVPDTVRAVARCGSGVNNIDVAALTERGIPVFNTPGANANAVKELALCGILLASRGIVEGIDHVHNIFSEEKTLEMPKLKKRVEDEKKRFIGQELAGKKLGVVGLGHIGASLAQTCAALGMRVSGYDPGISLESAWRLPGDVMERAKSLDELISDSDYISLHVPYMKETHHLIDSEMLSKMKPSASVINFARGELVDTQTMRAMYDSGQRTGRYITDFVDEYLHDHPKVVMMPHLGASTLEAEENAASMAAIEVRDFIERGTIVNSVNFPTTHLDRIAVNHHRICIVNKNVPGMLGLITSTLGRSGVNIIQHINASRGDIAYNVLDIPSGRGDDETLSSIQEEISKLDGIISSRFISGHRAYPGNFAVSH